MSKVIEDIDVSLKDTQEFNEALSKHLDKNFLVEGKTLTEWRKFFSVDIPDDLNFATLIKIAADISFKYQRASFFREKQTVQVTVLEQNKAEKYHSAYQFARSENEAKFGKPLAAESCKVAATLATKDLEDAIAVQRVVRDFWVKTCDTLTEMRKLLELIGYALSADAKVQRDFVVHGGN